MKGSSMQSWKKKGIGRACFSVFQFENVKKVPNCWYMFSSSTIYIFTENNYFPLLSQILDSLFSIRLQKRMK